MTTIGPVLPPQSSPDSPAIAGRGRREAVLLAAATSLLALALLLPWWTESETFGPFAWTQTFSPIWGVSGTCSPSCGAFGPGPPLGAIQGTHSFTSVGLTQTGGLYLGTLIAILIALAVVLAALLSHLIARAARRAPTSRSVLGRLLGVGAIAIGIAAAALPVLQPMAMRNDTVSKLSSNNSWTASPSPESSFWGFCTRHAFNGLCASGGSASWGPDWGWVALILALFVVVVLIWGRREPSNRSEAVTGAARENDSAPRAPDPPIQPEILVRPDRSGRTLQDRLTPRIDRCVRDPFMSGDPGDSPIGPSMFGPDFDPTAADCPPSRH